MTPEQRAARLHYHMYDSLEGIEQQSERIVALEELVEDLWPYAEGVWKHWPLPPDSTERSELLERMRKWGIEV